MPSKEELFQRYSQEILHAYNESSRIPKLTTIERIDTSQLPGFEKFAKKFLIPSEYFLESQVIIVRPFADFVTLSEFQYIIDTLNQISAIRIERDNPPDGTLIDQAIERISYVQPDFIIIPVRFFVILNRQNFSNDPIIRFENGNQYYINRGQRLKILWSNKYIKLNEIIIGSSNDSCWLYKSANDERLRVEFTDEGGFKYQLLIETIFKYRPPMPPNVAIIQFPEEK